MVGVACDACGKCAADAPDLIRMENNLPVIDYSTGAEARPEAVFRCATRSIVWLEREQFEDQESREAGTG
jgi:ferredoxin